jgi:hypothetical protein
MPRKKLDKPTRRMRDAAWRALADVVADPEAADHARVSAARALVRDDPDEADADANADNGPFIVLTMPTNGRDPGLTPLGITCGPGRRRTIFYDPNSEAGLADLERWRAEVDAEIVAAHPELLPAPEKPPALTGAERQRRHRERLKLALQIDAPATNGCD